MFTAMFEVLQSNGLHQPDKSERSTVIHLMTTHFPGVSANFSGAATPRIPPLTRSAVRSSCPLSDHLIKPVHYILGYITVHL